MTSFQGSFFAIDPGVHHCGVAYYAKGVLKAAALVKKTNPNSVGYEGALDLAAATSTWARKLSHRAELVIVERMRVYPGARAENPNDLLDVCAAASSIASILVQSQACRIESLFAFTWKGNVPKKIMTNRIKERLTTDEMLAVDLSCGRTLAHNVFDAIGIGLWKAGRL